MKMTVLNKMAALASKRSDVVIAAFLMLAIVMMIIPLPTALVDTLIGTNIAFSILIIIMAFYVSRSVEFSALPPVILMSTLFRLAISITTTRLILRDADAGQLVTAFGEFVISGQVVIGLVVFLIITVSQFLVITKGSERVAEVAARFTLDAMPGKQMSIDNDLRNGNIEPEEGARRRATLEKESQLYGAMDGAMKFVKGDAIAGIVILFINLFGGLMVGMFSHGMDFGTAVKTFSLLTVGDGLIAQIPALLIAVAAGIVVTRVSTDENTDLGSEMIRQFGRNTQALAITSVTLFLVAFIPGFPSLVFISLSAFLGGVAYWLSKRTEEDGATEGEYLEAEKANTAQASPEATPSEPIDAAKARVRVRVGDTLAGHLSMALLEQKMISVREGLTEELGFSYPSIGLAVDNSLEGEQYAIDIEEVPVSTFSLPAEKLAIEEDDVNLDLLGIAYEESDIKTSKKSTPAKWVSETQARKLDDAHVDYKKPDQLMVESVKEVLAQYAPDFLGIQEGRQLLDKMEADYPDLVREALKSTSLQKLVEVFKRLLEENISIRNLRAILEAIVEWGPKGLEIHVLSEHARSSLARQICHQHADSAGMIPAYVISRPFEESMRQALKNNSPSNPSGLPSAMVASLIAQLGDEQDRLGRTIQPVVVVSADLRRYIRQLIMRHSLELPVLSYHDVTREYSIQPLRTVRMEPPEPDSNSMRQPGGSPAMA